jgi:hypothetical protein
MLEHIQISETQYTNTVLGQVPVAALIRRHAFR